MLQHHPEISAAYLYGSYARGRPHRHSDLDVAVLLRERRGRLACKIGPAYEADLASEIGAALHHPRVEVVILNQASPLLAWQAIRHGQRLLARQAKTVARYELRVHQRYLDTAHLRAIQDFYLDGIVGNGFSKAVMR